MGILLPKNPLKEWKTCNSSEAGVDCDISNSGEVQIQYSICRTDIGLK